ncbi:heme-binding protein 2-like isoform X2 [Littorina saxatilis]
MEKIVIVLLGCFPLLVHGQAPVFCREFDCPSYTMTENSTEFEVRQYEPTSWVVTNVSSSGNVSAAFGRLYFYLDGRNDRDQQINMTVPVLRATGGGGNATIMFYLGIVNPPNPTDSSVSLLHLPQMSFFVRSFNLDHMPTDGEYERELRALESALGTQSSYDASVAYYAGYHAPWFQGERHNEIWLEQQ